MFKKLLLASVAALFATAVYAGNVPAISGNQPIDPSGEAGVITGLVQSINANTTGLLGTTITPVATTLTTIQTLATYTLNGGVLANAGQGLHVHVWGVNSADANVKTLTLAFGSANTALVVTGSGNTWFADFYVLKTGPSTQTIEGHGMTGTTPVAAVASTATQTDTAAITVLVEGTAATSGTITLSGGYIEQLK